MSELEIKCPICDGWFNVDTINGKKEKEVSEYSIYRDIMNLLVEPHIYKMPQGDYGFTDAGYSMDGFKTYEAAEKVARRLILVEVKNWIDEYIKTGKRPYNTIIKI